MKIRILTLAMLAIALLVSCNDVELTEFNQEVKIKKCKIPPGMDFGEVVGYLGNDKMEKKLISQFNSYCEAMMLGDYENMKIYMYDDIFKYIRSHYSVEYDDEDMVKEIIAENHVKDFFLAADSSGIEVSMVVGRMLRKIQQGDVIIYVMECYLNIGDENVQTYIPEIDIAISKNAGVDWQFLSGFGNSEMLNVLRVSLSDEVVDKVMAY